MKPPPPGWPRISASVYYDDPRAAIDWLCRAFGFEVQVKVEGDDGKIHHSQLVFGEGLVMVGGTDGPEPWHEHHASPRSIGRKITQALAVFVEDVDAHHARAVAAGAEIVRPPRTDDYGPEFWTDRTYGALDPEAHLWWFMQRMSGPSAK
jgi:uncharacterized glyoxalase superfamily protein PhnB